MENFLTESAKSIHLVILTEWKAMENDGNSSTIRRIVEECEKKKIDCKVIYISHAYFDDEGGKRKVGNIIKIGHVHPKTEKREIIEVDPSNTVVIARKSASETEKGLFFMANLEASGVFVINSKSSMEVCNNKFTTTMITQKAGVRNPATIILSKSEREQMEETMKRFNGNKYPVIIKTLQGEHGIGVMRVDSFQSMFSVLQTIWSRHIEVVVQEFIESDSDVRIIVLDGKYLAAMKRTHTSDDFRSNGHQGSNMTNYTPTPEEKKMAERSAEAVGGYWVGLDIITAKDGTKYLLEVNTSAGTEGIEEASGRNLISEFLDYITNRKNWKRNAIEAGYNERIRVRSSGPGGEDIGQFVAKLDTGNGINSSLHADNIMIDDSNNIVKFQIDNKKYELPLYRMYKVHLGKQVEVTEHRPSVLLDIEMHGRQLRKVEFYLTNRRGNIKELEPVLLCRDVINKFGFIVNASKKFVLGK